MRIKSVHFLFWHVNTVSEAITNVLKIGSNDGSESGSNAVKTDNKNKAS